MCCKTSKQRRNCSIVGIVIGLLLAAAGLIVQGVILKRVQAGIDDLVVVPSPGDDGYEAFINSDDSDNAPLYKKAWFFNLTNLDGVLNAGETPNFEEVGPYVWLKHERLFNVSYSDDGKKVEYNSWTWYTWEPELSMEGASPDDTFTTVWPTYLVAMDAAGSETNLAVAASGGIANLANLIFAGAVCLLADPTSDPTNPSSECWETSWTQWGETPGLAAIGLPAGVSWGAALLGLLEANNADAYRLIKYMTDSGAVPEYAAYSAQYSTLPGAPYTFDANMSAALWGAGDNPYPCPLGGNYVDGTPCSAVLVQLVSMGAAGLPSAQALWPGMSDLQRIDLAQYLAFIGMGTLNEYLEGMGQYTSATSKQFVYRTADQIMWYYEDPILILTGADATNSAFFSTSNASTEADAYLMDPGRTGLLTGKDDVANSKSYYMYSGFETLPARTSGPTSPGVWCDYNLPVSGHSSEQFPPGKAGLYEYEYGWDQSDHLTLWSTQIIRQVDLDFKRETTFQGIKVWEYGLSEEFLNPENYPEFNMSDPEYNTDKFAILNFVCPAGAAPIHITLPRFMEADMPEEWVVDGVGEPDPSIHRTLLYADPVTGATLLGSLRLQLNVLTPPPYASATEEKLLPVVWIEEHSEMTDSQAAAYEDSLLVFMQVQQAALIIVPSFGGLLIIIFIISTCHFQKRKKADEHDTDGMLELN